MLWCESHLPRCPATFILMLFYQISSKPCRSIVNRHRRIVNTNAILLPCQRSIVLHCILCRETHPLWCILYCTQIAQQCDMMLCQTGITTVTITHTAAITNVVHSYNQDYTLPCPSLVLCIGTKFAYRHSRQCTRFLRFVKCEHAHVQKN